MVRPKCFGFDPETATDNPMQQQDESQSAADIQRAALQEFDGMVATLRAEGIVCIVVEDTEDPPKPNAVFPNNWISFHGKDKAILYPMRTPSRRVERRSDIFQTIAAETGATFEPNDSLVANEISGKFLEGTGSIIFDYEGECAYACLSERTNPGVVCDLGTILDDVYFHVFEAFDSNGRPIYHTNVMMCIASKYAVVCLSAIRDKSSREMIVTSLESVGREIVEITLDQVDQFAGNMLEVLSSEDNSSKLVMSATAFAALTEAQKAKLSSHSKLVAVPVPTIEKYGGGSVRCMMCSVLQGV
ncbi:unnamed protein product [Ectocarpus fasciculatus]